MQIPGPALRRESFLLFLLYHVFLLPEKACPSRKECILYSVGENCEYSCKPHLNLLNEGIKEFGKLLFKAMVRSERLTGGMVFLVCISEGEY